VIVLSRDHRSVRPALPPPASAPNVGMASARDGDRSSTATPRSSTWRVKGGRRTVDRGEEAADSRQSDRFGGRRARCHPPGRREATGAPPGLAGRYYGSCGDEIVTEERAAGEDFLAEVCREWRRARPPSRSSESGAPSCAPPSSSREPASSAEAAPPFPSFRRRSDGQWPAVDPLDPRRRRGRRDPLLLEARRTRPFNLSAPDRRPIATSPTRGKVLETPELLPSPAFALHLGARRDGEALLTRQRAVPRALNRPRVRFGIPKGAGAPRPARDWSCAPRRLASQTKAPAFATGAFRYGKWTLEAEAHDSGSPRRLGSPAG